MTHMADEKKNAPEADVNLKTQVAEMEKSIEALTDRVKALEDAPAIPTPVMAGEPEEDPLRMLYRKGKDPRPFKESKVEAALKEGWQKTPLKRNKRGEA